MRNKVKQFAKDWLKITVTLVILIAIELDPSLRIDLTKRR